MPIALKRIHFVCSFAINNISFQMRWVFVFMWFYRCCCCCCLDPLIMKWFLGDYCLTLLVKVQRNVTLRYNASLFFTIDALLHYMLFVCLNSIFIPFQHNVSRQTNLSLNILIYSIRAPLNSSEVICALWERLCSYENVKIICVNI